MLVKNLPTKRTFFVVTNAVNRKNGANGSMIDLIIALKKTYNAEIEIKSNSSIRKDLLIKNLIIELCATVSSA